jgi:sec-independent protein translocase protein TatC
LILPASTILLSDAISSYLIVAVFSLPYFFVLFLAIRGTGKPEQLLLCLPVGVFVALLVSAYLTPTTDILNVTLFSLPMIGLYVVSIVIAWFHPIHRRARAEKQRTSSHRQS